jgi:hypothetical protein
MVRDDGTTCELYTAKLSIVSVTGSNAGNAAAKAEAGQVGCRAVSIEDGKQGNTPEVYSLRQVTTRDQTIPENF